MKKLKLVVATVLVATAFVVSLRSQPVLVTNAPASGTFYFIRENPSMPWPFDPALGVLPIYFYDGVYFVDDTSLLGGGGGMLLSSLPGPGPGIGCTNCPPITNICSGPTNFTVTYQLSTTNTAPYGTNDLWLEMTVATNNVATLIIHTPTTNASYDIFGTTNLSVCVPPLNQTNWMGLQRANGVSTNFLWTNITPCEAWFQLGTMWDDDLDGLTSAYEHLVSHTTSNNADTDGDGRSDGQELLIDNTDPRTFTPQRLVHFPFNDTNWLGSAGQMPLAVSNAVSKDAWFTKALQIENSGYAFLKYRDVETNLNANILLNRGSIRFWFKSNWDTGTGTSNQARLIEVGTKGTGTTNGWWSLYFSKTNGTEITFAAETNNAGATYLTGTNSWRRNDWNQFVLNYTATNSALYLNSSLVATGLGVTLWPGATVRADGFRVGSDASGTNQAQGIFEDLEIFNYPLSTNDIAANFQTNRPPNAISSLWAWYYGSDGEVNSSFQMATWQDHTSNGNEAFQPAENNKPFLITNAVNGRSAIGLFGTNAFRLPTFPATWTNAEVFLVLKAKYDPAPAGGVTRAFWNFGRGPTIYPSTGGDIYDPFFRWENGTSTGNPSTSLTNFHLYNAISTSNSFTRMSNGTEMYTVSEAQGHLFWIVTYIPIIGKDSGADQPFEGTIAEMLLFSRALTGTERTNIQNYINVRYAIW